MGKIKLLSTSLSTLTRKSSAVFGLLLLVSGATLFFSPQTVLASTLWNDVPILDTTWGFSNDGGTTVGGGNFQSIMNYGNDLTSIAGDTVSGFAVYMPSGAASRYVTYAQANHGGVQNLGIFECARNGAGVPTNGDCSQSPGSYGNFYFLSSSGWSGIYADGDWLVVPLTTTFTARLGYTLVVSYFYDANNDSTLYYIGGTNQGACSQWNIREHSATQNTCSTTTLKKPQIIIYGSTFTPPVIPPTDPLVGTTHVASTTPADLQNTATSTNYYFGVTGEITPDDYDSTAWVEMAYYNDTFAQAAVSPSVVTETKKWDIATSGAFSFSTTTNFSTAHLGRYYMTTSIKKDRFTIFGFSFWSQTIASKYTTFYVSTSTAHITVTGWDSLVDMNNPANITAIEAGITTCDFSWGDLASTTKISSFLTCLVVPDSHSLAITFNQFQNNVLTLAPWGYITRFVNILASTTPVKPPPLTYKFGSSSPAVLQAYTASDPITFQVFDYMGSSSPLLQIKADDGSNKNVWGIIDPFITFLVTIGVLLVILGDIMGFEMPHGQTENERMRKIDYSKMSDKEFQKRVKIEYVTEEEQRMQRRNRL